MIRYPHAGYTQISESYGVTISTNYICLINSQFQIVSSCKYASGVNIDIADDGGDLKYVRIRYVGGKSINMNIVHDPSALNYSFERHAKHICKIPRSIAIMYEEANSGRIWHFESSYKVNIKYKLTRELFYKDLARQIIWYLLESVRLDTSHYLPILPQCTKNFKQY